MFETLGKETHYSLKRLTFDLKRKSKSNPESLTKLDKTIKKNIKKSTSQPQISNATNTKKYIIDNFNFNDILLNEQDLYDFVRFCQINSHLTNLLCFYIEASTVENLLLLTYYDHNNVYAIIEKYLLSGLVQITSKELEHVMFKYKYREVDVFKEKLDEILDILNSMFKIWLFD